jgi:hypothetical protein
VGRGVTTITEDVLVAYIENVKRRFATSSMWTKYSILNYYIVIFQDMIKKTRILEQFLKVPPDEEYLIMKVIVFFFFLLSL